MSRNRNSSHKNTGLSNDDILVTYTTPPKIPKQAAPATRLFGCQEFLTALEKSGSTDAENAAGIEKPIPDPGKTYCL